MNPRRLYRCRHDRQLAGVAAGMAEYLDLDPTVVRLAWLLSIFLGGFTILLYVILAFVIPLEPLPEGAGPGWAPGGYPGWVPAGPAAATGATGATPAGDASGATGEAATGEEGTAGWPAPGTAAPGTAVPGWQPGGWQAGTWQAPPSGHVHRPSDGRGGLFLGVLLVAFGSIAMAGVLLPGWAAVGLIGPGFLVALGVAFMALALTRRSVSPR